MWALATARQTTTKMRILAILMALFLLTRVRNLSSQFVVVWSQIVDQKSEVPHLRLRLIYPAAVLVFSLDVRIFFYSQPSWFKSTASCWFDVIPKDFKASYLSDMDLSGIDKLLCFFFLDFRRTRGVTHRPLAQFKKKEYWYMSMNIVI